jgi:hypothetical protein
MREFIERVLFLVKLRRDFGMDARASGDLSLKISPSAEAIQPAMTKF